MAPQNLNPVIIGLLMGAVSAYPICPGSIDMTMNGDVTSVAITRNNHSSAGSDPYYSGPVDVDNNAVLPGMTDEITSSGTRTSGRAYFSSSCNDDGSYDNNLYSALQLLDSTISYTVDLSGAACGCNSAFYLTSMRQNTDKSTCDDYYCDANSVCDVMCTEIDIQEANVGSWLTTAHMGADPSGQAVGYGGGGSEWSGPRDFDSTQYGPSSKATINTLKPFEVSASFPTTNGVLSSIDMSLEQSGNVLSFSLESYTFSGTNGFVELTTALQQGMTPIVSYWSSNDMQWLDGTGSDGQGACAQDVPADCGSTTSFSDISVTPYTKTKQLQHTHQKNNKH
jgi:hypothetical protein